MHLWFTDAIKLSIFFTVIPFHLDIFSLPELNNFYFNIKTDAKIPL